MFSFDTPLSAGGLFLNLSTWQAFSERHLPLDAERTGNNLYLWEKWHKARALRTSHPTAVGARMGTSDSCCTQARSRAPYWNMGMCKALRTAIQADHASTVPLLRRADVGLAISLTLRCSSYYPFATHVLGVSAIHAQTALVAVPLSASTCATPHCSACLRCR